MNTLVAKEIGIEGIAEEHNEGCDEGETAGLREVFKDLIIKTTAFSAHKAWFNLGDVSLAQGRCVGHFKLTLERVDHSEGMQWIGTFEAEGQYLKLVSVLIKRAF